MLCGTSNITEKNTVLIGIHSWLHLTK